MEPKELLDAVKPCLMDAYGARLRDVMLYGSEARGEARADSDILVLLDGPVRLWPGLRVALRALLPLSLRLDRPISPKPVTVEYYEKGACPLYQHAKAEGVRA